MTDKKAPPIPAKKFKTVLTREMIATVKALMLKKLPLEYVSAGIGITERTLSRWRQEGLDENCTDELKVELAVVMDECRAFQGGKIVEMYEYHAKDDWRAAQALATALDRAIWSPKVDSKVDVKAEVESVSSLDFSGLSFDEQLLLRELLAKGAKKSDS